MLQLISMKCVPALMYGLEALSLNKSELSSLDFVVNCLFMKLFKSANIQFIIECQTHFGFKLPNELWVKRCHKFNNKFGPADQLCGLYSCSCSQIYCLYFVHCHVFLFMFILFY